MELESTIGLSDGEGRESLAPHFMRDWFSKVTQQTCKGAYQPVGGDIWGFSLSSCYSVRV